VARSIYFFLTILALLPFGWLVFRDAPMRAWCMKRMRRLQDGEIAALEAKRLLFPWRRVQIARDNFFYVDFDPVPCDACGIMIFEPDGIRIVGLTLMGFQIEIFCPSDKITPVWRHVAGVSSVDAEWISMVIDGKECSIRNDIDWQGCEYDDHGVKKKPAELVDLFSLIAARNPAFRGLDLG